MLKDNWLERQIKTVKELIENGAKEIKENKLVGAEAKLREAEVILDSAEVIDHRVLRLRATVYNELGVVATQTGSPQVAANYHVKSIATLEQIDFEAYPEYVPRLAASRLNLGGILASVGQFDDAEVHNRAAIELLTSLDDAPSIQLMRLGAYQNLGIVLINTDKPGPGLEALEQASKVADALIEGGNAGVRPSLVQILLNSSVAQHRVDRHELAIETGNRAADLAQELFKETKADAALQMFLTCQMNLVTFNQKAGSFADAEDALFKVLDVVPGHPDVVARGKAFYGELLELTDEELEEGGLPRDEVEESLSELGEMKAE